MDNRIKNVYWMLAYAFNVLREKNTRSMELEEFNNITNLFSAILITHLNAQIKKGLMREYIEHEEALSGIKGKIQLNESIKQNTFINHKLVCEFDEYSTNSYANRIVKTTLIYLLKAKKEDLEDKYRKEIKRLLLYFKDIDEVDVNSINWSRVIFNKNNISYKLIINVCNLVLCGMLQTNEKGKKEITDFVSDEKMSALYERFLRNYYIRHFPKLKAKALQVDWNIPKTESLGLLPTMKTDITLTYKEKTLVIDAKYYGKTLNYDKRFNTKTIHSGNMYQIFTYVKNLDKEATGNVTGMLLYAKTNEDIVPNQENIIGDNKFIVRTLDLTVDFEKVREQLNDIAEKFTNYELKSENN